MANGKLITVPLELEEGSRKWKLDFDLLESRLTPNTKILLLNTPHNPTGKVFTVEELEKIAAIVVKFPNLVVVTDEVYEKLVYDGQEHVRFAGVSITSESNEKINMFDRTLTISSCGKTFSCTGWKVGWVYGPEELVKPVMLANQWIQYCVSTPTQRALAKILQQASAAPYEGFPSYYEYICNHYQKKRDQLVQALEKR